MRVLQILFLMVLAAPVWAAGLPEDVLSRIGEADVVIVGEVHDNPAHHRNQHDILKALQPKAVVWEMLTREEAGRISSEMIHAPDRLEAALDWSQSGWPAFSMYHQLFIAAPGARIFGGEVPREAAMKTLQSGPATVFGADAERYGLTDPLPEAEKHAREALQFAAHCEAVPMERMRAMVDIQRLRDAVLAREVVAALTETGGPVAVITGNGHARRDWGIPVYLDQVRPGLSVFAVGQSEGGEIAGVFDAVIDSDPPAREDPCRAFRNEG
ncbi:ChaN family lipoprotein [Sedimentitalea todarodis]|uniref:ChaN family lipoprotein n=1 Tax=Sedimentitalea todarodis TaxID=1631240 RepID=A0ABU3VFP6_9RHOB|nr:ChaN family lipoprotein [Sedimentitalea todarodis]MDU9004999.1 ChaN family lipoprotein [Sedimentitalea todarodis]